MSKHIADANNCLRDNNARGMSPSKEPYVWNLHNAVAALINELEEQKVANQNLATTVAILEAKILKN